MNPIVWLALVDCKFSVAGTANSVFVPSSRQKGEDIAHCFNDTCKSHS